MSIIEITEATSIDTANNTAYGMGVKLHLPKGTLEYNLLAADKIVDLEPLSLEEADTFYVTVTDQVTGDINVDIEVFGLAITIDYVLDDELTECSTEKLQVTDLATGNSINRTRTDGLDSCDKPDDSIELWFDIAALLYTRSKELKQKNICTHAA